MAKSGKVQKAIRPTEPEKVKPKTKADAVHSSKKTGEKPEKLGDNRQEDRQDSRQIEKQE